MSSAPNTFTVEAWIRTNTTEGERSLPSAIPEWHQRHVRPGVYMDNSGRIWFGVKSGATGPRRKSRLPRPHRRGGDLRTALSATRIKAHFAAGIST